LTNPNVDRGREKPVADSDGPEVGDTSKRGRKATSALPPLLDERVVDPGIPLLHRIARNGGVREIPKSYGRQWRTYCPCCDTSRMNRHLGIRLTGAEPEVECSNGCPIEAVLARLDES
jgi:hypothetical protein